MPAPIIIDLTPQARAIMLKLQKFPVEMAQAIKRGMDQAGNIAWGGITLSRFSGKGPYPVPMHRLGERTERLKQSLFYKAARIEAIGPGVSVVGTMGSFGVRYFTAHEYGFSGTVNVRAHARKLYRRTSLTTGKKLKRPKQKGYTIVRAHTMNMNIPERAPLRTGIDDHKIVFQRKIQQELDKTLNALP